jgi:hypothetical protein
METNAKRGAGMLMKRRDVLRRYRNLRAICTRHHTAAVKFLAQSAIMESARRLGLTAGQALITDSTEELTLVFDLAIYTAKQGRTRAIDRYAKAAQLPAGSDEMQMLEAMRRARFSIWRIERRHDTFGLVVADQLRQAETWLVDEGLAATARHGMCFAGRLCEVGQFAVTNGVMVPVHGPMIEQVLTDNLASCRVGQPQVGDEPRFAAAIYRAALDDGIMHRVAFN